MTADTFVGALRPYSGRGSVYSDEHRRLVAERIDPPIGRKPRHLARGPYLLSWHQVHRLGWGFVAILPGDSFQ